MPIRITARGMVNRIIDAHTHAWTDEKEMSWETTGPPGAESIVYTVENVREDMEALGVDEACLVATPIHGRGSEYTRSCVRATPDDMYGILWLDYKADDIADRVDDALGQENILGFRFYAEGGDDITSKKLNGFWRALEGWTDPQVHFLLRPWLLEAAESIVAAHPDVTFVFDHLAQPKPGKHNATEPPYSTLSQISDYSNAYVKVTKTPAIDPFPFTELHEYIRFLVNEFGSERLLWGSDFIYHFKQATPWETLHFLDQMEFISSGERRDLLYRTFESMLP